MQSPPETIGQRLKRLRLERKLTLEQVFEATRIRPHYLEALENDDFSVMSSAAQGRGFLRLYAEFLGLDLEAARRELEQAATASSPLSETPPEAGPTSPALPASAPEPEAGLPEPQAERRPFWTRPFRRTAATSARETPAAPPQEQTPTAPQALEDLTGEALPAEDRRPAADTPAQERLETLPGADEQTSLRQGKPAAVPSGKKKAP